MINSPSMLLFELVYSVEYKTKHGVIAHSTYFHLHARDREMSSVA